MIGADRARLMLGWVSAALIAAGYLLASAYVVMLALGALHTSTSVIPAPSFHDAVTLVIAAVWLAASALAWALLSRRARARRQYGPAPARLAELDAATLRALADLLDAAAAAYRDKCTCAIHLALAEHCDRQAAAYRTWALRARGGAVSTRDGEQ